MPQTLVQGQPIFFQEYGDGEPVLLLHGLAGSGRWWRRNIPALATRYRVIALSLNRRRDWVNSRPRWSVTSMAPVLVEWLDRVGLERAHVIGHSLGGHIGIRLAAHAPERVNRLVLVDAAGLPLGASMLGMTRRVLTPAPDRTRPFLRIVVEDAIRANPLLVWRTAADLLRDDVSQLLDRVVSPTLIVWGERDQLVPVANAYILRERIKDARLLVLPGAGHNPMFHHPGTFNRAVLAFLAGQEGEWSRS